MRHLESSGWTRRALRRPALLRALRRPVPRALPLWAGPLLAVLLAACSGGAKTTANPDTQAVAVAAYTGPPPTSSDVQAFKVNLWANIVASDRCGGCHKAGGQSPMFARSDDINQAYSAALTVVNLAQPDQSTMVIKVGGGHNCWLSSPQACADILTTWIRNWAGGAGGAGSTQIVLTAPVDRTVGASKTFPADPSQFSTTVYPLLTQFCSRCHSPAAGTPQQPYFASADVNQAYAAAQSKIDLDDPTLSRFYVRLATESHNCWATTPGGGADCPGSAARMLAAIQAFANAIPVTQVDPSLVLSKALMLYDGVIASGGNRYDANVIARWMFKEGTGPTAFDTSGVDPSLDLTLAGDVSWVGGWGLSFGPNGGKAQGITASSSKLFNRISASGEYSVELWAAPANVTQQNAFMASYSGGTAVRNFTLAQNMYQYQAFGRSTATNVNGAPALATNATAMDAQASLQHVVLTYDATHGRRLYINGVFTGDVDPETSGALSNWDSTFAFLLGNETSSDRKWQGVIRFAAIHDHALTLDEIQQNFAAGVGERYFLLFNVSALTGVNMAYVMFEVSRYDSYSYLFNKPIFISLDPAAKPGNIPIQGMYIGMNGSEVQVGQAYAPLSLTVSNTDYAPGTGQLLSPIGTVVALQKGPDSDLFFLSFDRIGTFTHVRTAATPVAAAPTDIPLGPDVGLRVFNEVNTMLSQTTTVPTTNTAVTATYQAVQQQLPPLPDVRGFLASQEVGSVQLAMQYCNALVQDPTREPQFFPGLNLNQSPAAAFGTQAGMDLVVTPLIQSPGVGVNLATQPTDTQIRTELYALITTLAGSADQSTARTSAITAAACTAVMGSATALFK
jgi:hypothetical protein